MGFLFDEMLSLAQSYGERFFVWDFTGQFFRHAVSIVAVAAMERSEFSVSIFFV